MNDLVVLRWHVEAVWGMAVPDLMSSEVILAADALPPWSLYLAQVQGQRVQIWRPDVAESARPLLLARGEAALATPTTEHPSVSCEVVLRRAVPAPAGTPVPAQRQHGMPPSVEIVAEDRTARLMTVSDTPLLEAFEPGESAYYLASQCAPLAGAIERGRLVSVAHSSRRTALACELGVETRSDARGHGFGQAVTRLWTAAVQAEGLLPLYSALATNAPSLALAASAGYRPIAYAAQVSLP